MDDPEETEMTKKTRNYASNTCWANAPKAQKGALIHMMLIPPKSWSCANFTYSKDAQRKKSASTCIKGFLANIGTPATGAWTQPNRANLVMTT